MRRVITSLVAVFVFLFLAISPANAINYITITNPVRGEEGWQQSGQNPLALPQLQYQESTPSAIPITWLLRFDAVTSPKMSPFFQNLVAKDKNQFIGGFLEVTPSLVTKANVEYPKGNSIFDANRIFLSGYLVEDRIKIIDTYMSEFFNRFGTYPSAVGAWHLDSFSIKYLKEKYSVISFMNCDDQYSTDRYRIWGGPIGQAYIPSNLNSLLPASNHLNNSGVAMFRWAQRDLFNFYQPGKENSLYSFQINDYSKLSLSNAYFQKLISQYTSGSWNDYGYINIGLENDDNLLKYGAGIKDIFKIIAKLSTNSEFKISDLRSVGEKLVRMYPEQTASSAYLSTDPLGKSDEKTFWYFGPSYRLGLISDGGIAKIIDFRVFNQNIYEDFYSTPNQFSGLLQETSYIVDSLKFPSQKYTVDLNLNNLKISKNYSTISINDGEKQLILSPDKITATGFSLALPQNSNLTPDNTQVSNSLVYKITPLTPFKPSISPQILSVIICLILSMILIWLKKINYLIVFLLSLPVIVTTIKSGDLYSFGFGLWGANTHDAVFHLSIINHFAKHPFSLAHPQYSGANISNYHLGFDILISFITRFGLNPSVLYFNVFPVFAIFTISLLSYALLKQLKFTPFQTIFGVVSSVLVGSLGFVPGLIQNHTFFVGESLFWAMQPFSMMINPPFVLSLIFLLGFFNIYFHKIMSLNKIILLILFGGLLAQVKIYAFVLLVLSLFATGNFTLSLIIGLIGFLINLPLSTFSGSPFQFEPMWFVKTMFAAQDRLYSPYIASTWNNLESLGAFKKLLFINIIGLIIFILGNFSVKILAFREAYKNKLLFIFIIIGILLPIVFTQKSNPWNTIQFIYYSIFFLGLFSGKFIDILIKNIKSKPIISILVLPFLYISIATSVGTAGEYLSGLSSTRISYSELSALENLKNQPEGIVLTQIYNPISGNSISNPKPIYAYASTAYISAFSGQPEYLSDTINLDITNINYFQRAKNIQRLFNTTDGVWVKHFLSQENIKYVYQTPLTTIKINPSEACLEKIFDNAEIKIYQFNCHVQN